MKYPTDTLDFLHYGTYASGVTQFSSQCHFLQTCSPSFWEKAFCLLQGLGVYLWMSQLQNYNTQIQIFEACVCWDSVGKLNLGIHCSLLDKVCVQIDTLGSCPLCICSTKSTECLKKGREGGCEENLPVE